jgi:hypothetical protein
MNLVGERPESTLPDHSGLSISQPQVVFIINTLRAGREVETSNIVPEGNDDESGTDSKNLEPTFRVDVVKGEIGVTFEGTPHRESVRGVFLLENRESVDHIRGFEGHLIKNRLLGVVVLGVEYALLKANVFVVIFTNGTSGPLAHPLGTIFPVVGP